MRLLLVLAFACVPSFPQATPFFSPRPLQKSKNPCDLPPSQRRPFAGFDFCTPSQSDKAAAPASVKPPAMPELHIVCSIPLVNVLAVETHDSMVVPAPPAQAPFVVEAPAPPCEDRHR